MKRYWLSGLFLVAVIAPACAPTPSPTPIPTSPPGHPSEIAYVGNDGRVFVLNLESQAIRVMPGPGRFSDPVWSPDGWILAYVRGGDPWAEGNEIWMATAGGGGNKVADGYAPEWASDGQLLLVSNFQTSEQGSAQSLIIYHPASGSQTELVTQFWMGGFWPIEEARHSVDGKWIAVYVNGLEAEGQLFLVNAETGQVWELPDFIYTVGNYDWAPESALIAFRDSGEPFRGGEDPSLAIFDAQARSRSVSLEDGYFWPRWSPQGETLALFQIQEGDGFQVWTVFPNGAGLALINEETFQPIWGADPTWSPRGEEIVFNALFDATTGEVGVYVMDMGSGRVTLLTKGENPQARWSPDGSQIAISLGREGSRELYLVNPDGAGLVKVAEGSDPAWRP